MKMKRSPLYLLLLVPIIVITGGNEEILAGRQKSITAWKDVNQSADVSAIHVAIATADKEKKTKQNTDAFVFAISPMASPVATASNFSEFVDYFSEKLEREVVLKQRRTYSEINELLRTGKALVAFTGTGAYLAGRHDFGLELLAIPVMNGKTTYNSCLIVHKDSSVKNFEQLKGKTFAFTDPLSLTGKLYPTYLLNERGILIRNYFGNTFYTSAHEKSIEAVAKKLADGAFVDGHIMQDLQRRGNQHALNVKVIMGSQQFGISPFVASPMLPENGRKAVLRILLNMPKDEKGREILKKLGIEGFVLPDHAIYFSAYEVKKKVRE